MNTSRAKEILKICILCLVIAGVWLLFSVPVIVYHSKDSEVIYKINLAAQNSCIVSHFNLGSLYIDL